MTTTFFMIITKRAELTQEQFIEYYESEHLRLVARLVGGRPRTYRRHYSLSDDPLLTRLVSGRGDPVTQGVAAITELTFETRADAEQMVDGMLQADVLTQILSDEKKFIADNGIRWVMTTRS